MSIKIIGRLLVAALAPVSLCLAQSDGMESQGIRYFEPVYFSEFDPVTALDLVERTPGFNPQEQTGGRGLDGVRSNILINGSRPPPKGQSTWQLLSNRPYTSVIRIELIDTSAKRDIDMQGYNQVVNVILEEGSSDYYELSSQYSHTGDGDARQRNEDDMEVDATASFSWREHEFNLRGGTEEGSTLTPPDFVNIDPANPEQRLATRNESEMRGQYLELSSIFALPADSTLSMNAQMNSGERTSAPVAQSGDGGASVSESFTGEREWRELSAEYRRPVWERGEMMWAVVDSRNTDASDSSFAVDGDLLTSVREQESGETASRLRLTYKPGEDLTLRSTVSTAFNFFEGTFSVFENGELLPLDGGDSRVEEDRHSLTLEADWNWRDNWLLRGSISGGGYQIETREISSDMQPEFKGWASAAYQPWERTTITAESRYDIGQLSLSQFLASSNLSSEILQAGAVSLDSERQWEHTLNYDQRFGDRGVLQFELGYQEVLNPIRSVPLSDSLIVSQNTFAEERTWFDASVEYPLERFDMEDLVINAGFNVADSETIDPVTEETRPVSWVSPLQWSLGMRKNPGEGQWSWGFNLWKRMYNDDFWVRETREQWRSHEWRAFVQWEIINGLRLSARLESPRSDTRIARYFSRVRQSGLDPSYIAVTDSRRDSSTSVSLQWRREKYLEITATINPRPRFRSEERLRAFNEMESTVLTREIARGPGAQIQVRLYNR